MTMCYGALAPRNTRQDHLARGKIMGSWIERAVWEASQAHDTAPDTAMTNVGRCAVVDCKESHPVQAFSLWHDSDGNPLTQWRGWHHGASYVYETFMVTRTEARATVPSLPVAALTCNACGAHNEDGCDCQEASYTVAESPVSMPLPAWQYLTYSIVN